MTQKASNKKWCGIILASKEMVRALNAAGVAVSGILFGVLIIESLVPAAAALAVAALIGDVYRLGNPALVGNLVVPLSVFGAVLLVGHAAESIARPLEFFVRARVDGEHRSRVLRLVSGGGTADALESPEVQRLIREGSADPKNLVDYTPADGAVGLLKVMTGLLGLVGSSVVLARYSLWLVPILVVPALVICALRNREASELVRKLRFAYRDEMFADVWRRATVSPSEGKDVRIFGFGDWMVERMDQYIRSANSPFWGHLLRVIRNRWWHFLLVLGGLVPVYVVVTVSATTGSTSVAVQTAVFSAGLSLFQALGNSEDFQRVVGAVHVLDAISTLADRVVAGYSANPGTQRTDVLVGAPPVVRLENIGFAYTGARRPVLAGVNLTIQPGELLAIVGMNGAGKSTLIKLLAGLYHPTTGRITANGTDIAEWGERWWRTQLSVVFQDFVRYHLSVADNIVLGKANAPQDLAAVVSAGRAAGLDQVVDQLPHGWDTKLARSREGGVDLSGGQWQQVVLARALYAVSAGAKLLVLDEPTAHLDVRTEFEVFQRLAEHRGDTSVVLISHRLSTVRQADRIVLLDGGRITESGTHDELIALDGGYAEMFAIQAERFRRGYDDRIGEGELL